MSDARSIVSENAELKSEILELKRQLAAQVLHRKDADATIEHHNDENERLLKVIKDQEDQIIFLNSQLCDEKRKLGNVRIRANELVFTVDLLKRKRVEQKQAIDHLQFDYDDQELVISSLTKERDELASRGPSVEDFELIKSLNAKNDELNTDLEIAQFANRKYQDEFKSTQEQNQLHYQKCNDQQKQINELQEMNNDLRIQLTGVGRAFKEINSICEKNI